jgi:5-methylcytosine-specific restriction protein A
MSVWPYNTRRWGRLRLLKFQESPLCEICLRDRAEVVPAEVVDHRIPISERGRREHDVVEAFPALDALASLCAPHHNQKSRAEQLGDMDYMHKGCDVFGRPLDRDHQWNKEGVKTKGSR